MRVVHSYTQVVEPVAQDDEGQLQHGKVGKILFRRRIDPVRVQLLEAAVDHVVGQQVSHVREVLEIVLQAFGNPGDVNRIVSSNNDTSTDGISASEKFLSSLRLGFFVCQK